VFANLGGSDLSWWPRAGISIQGKTARYTGGLFLRTCTEEGRKFAETFCKSVKNGGPHLPFCCGSLKKIRPFNLVEVGKKGMPKPPGDKGVLHLDQCEPTPSKKKETRAGFWEKWGLLYRFGGGKINLHQNTYRKIRRESLITQRLAKIRQKPKGAGKKRDIGRGIGKISSHLWRNRVPAAPKGKARGPIRKREGSGRSSY